MAEPAGIYISRAARDQVVDRLPFSFEDLGDHTLKNIARPVRVFRVVADGLPSRPDVDFAGSGFSLPSRPAVAVMPFDTMGADSATEIISSMA